jgi:hypothetical protein
VLQQKGPRFFKKRHVTILLKLVTLVLTPACFLPILLFRHRKKSFPGLKNEALHLIKSINRTIVKTIKHLDIMKATPIFQFHNYVVKAILAWSILAIVVLSSCSKDKNEVIPVAAFEGNYEATKSNNTKYTMTIEKKSGNQFQIKNFAGFLNAPLNATAAGTTMTIPTQTFTNPNGKQLILSGTASLTGDELSVQYSVRGFTEYDSDLLAKRK